MSDTLSELETAIVAALKASEWLKKVATLETSIRECLFSGDKLTAGFQGHELPAIAVSCQLDPVPSSMFTTCEEASSIPVTLTIVTRAANGKLALAAGAEIWAGVAHELRQFRRSGNVLGENTVLMGDVTTSATTIDEKPFSYAIRSTKFTVLKIVQLYSEVGEE